MAFREDPSRRGGGGETEWLTLGQAARFLGVAQSTIRKWSDQGRVPAFYTPGGHRRYRRLDLEHFLDRSGPGGKGRPGPLVLLVKVDEQSQAEAEARGARGFVGKPFDLQQLIEQTKQIAPT